MSERVEIVNGDCLEVLRSMPDCSVDAVVTDPPYGLSFMGKKWDYDVPSVEVWAECLRVLKHGGHLLAFAGTRTQHRMAVRIEDAGFEIRDMIAWVYGSGFPKSLDVSKAIDKAAGAEREVVGEIRKGAQSQSTGRYGAWAGGNITAPATDAAKQWQGWGTALKPALEPITVARKPLVGTVAENVLQHSTGAINIDGARVGMAANDTKGEFGPRKQGIGENNTNGIYGGGFARQDADETKGRWPANFIHDGSKEVVGLFPMTVGAVGMTKHASGTNAVYGDYARTEKSLGGSGIPDKGSAARFFYCAKASKADRDAGCERMDSKQMDESRKKGNPGGDNPRNRGVQERVNFHPTVKPTDLMRYLCRLVTPPNGIVLDPFMGSGSTGKAAVLEGFRFIGIEREEEYCEIAKARIKHVCND